MMIDQAIRLPFFNDILLSRAVQAGPCDPERSGLICNVLGRRLPGSHGPETTM